MDQILRLLAGNSRIGIGSTPRRHVDHGRRLASARPGSSAALACADIAAAALSLLLTWLAVTSDVLPAPLAPDLLTNGAATVFGDRPAFLVEFAVIVAGLVGYFAMQGHYHRRVPLWWKMPGVIAASLVGVLCSASLEFAFNTGTARSLVLGTWLLFSPMAALLRGLTRRLLQSVGLWHIRTIVVGNEAAIERVTDALTSEPELGYRIVGVVPSSTVGEAPGDGYWTRMMHQFRAHLVVLAPELDQPLDRAINDELVLENVPFAVMPQAAGLPVSGSVQPYFFKHDLTMVSYGANIARPVPRAVKIALDLVGASLLVLFLSPLLLAIALAVSLDGGPVLYAHMRVGASKRRFPCLKFRSMSQNSAAILEHVLSTDPDAAAEWAATQKLRNDPRVTRVGALLRRTSLDELPQLFNVLRLEMSLVGPRPIVESEVRHYGENIAYYYKARPGVTGLWQVSGRSDTTYVRRVELDTWYVRNWTLWNDLAILGKTLPAVLKRTGAV